MASDGKDFKASGLRRSPGSNARTTWTLRHGCCYMGKVVSLWMWFQKVACGKKIICDNLCV